MIIIILTLPSKGQLISKGHYLGVFKDLFMSSCTLFWDIIFGMILRYLWVKIYHYLLF